MSNHLYTKKHSAEQVTKAVDLNGKNIVITGVNSGLGKETMRVLALRGAHIIGLARNADKAQQAADDLGIKIAAMTCELSDFDSVVACADEINALNQPIDILICNAGIMAPPSLQLEQGYEAQFTTNHMGHFILINRLLNKIKAAQQGRIVMLSSEGHRVVPKGGIDFDNLDGSKGYSGLRFYGQSKLANLLTAVALAEQLKSSSATANAVHPGVINTDLGRRLSLPLRMVLLNPISEFFIRTLFGGKTIEQGASTQCYVATAPDLAEVSGKYFADNNEAKPTYYGTNVELANRLWCWSEEQLKDYL